MQLANRRFLLYLSSNQIESLLRVLMREHRQRREEGGDLTTAISPHLHQWCRLTGIGGLNTATGRRLFTKLLLFEAEKYSEE